MLELALPKKPVHAVSAPVVEFGMQAFSQQLSGNEQSPSTMGTVGRSLAMQSSSQ